LDGALFVMRAFLDSDAETSQLVSKGSMSAFGAEQPPLLE